MTLPSKYSLPSLLYWNVILKSMGSFLSTFQSPEPDPIEIQKQQEAHRKMLARRRAKEESEVHAPEVEDAANRVDVQTGRAPQRPGVVLCPKNLASQST